MHFCPVGVVDWADSGSVRLARADPPPLAYGKLALLSQTLAESGATLLPSALRAMPRFADPLVLDPENCAFVGDRDGNRDGSVRMIKKYSVWSEGPRFSLRYAFVPRYPSDTPDPEPIVPDWVHPSLLEPDPPRGAGVEVNGRVFPHDELHAYCAKGTVNTIKYQAEDNARDTPRVHVVLSEFGAAEEKIMLSLLAAHVDHRLTVDACCVQGGAKWYRFTSQLHRRPGFKFLNQTPRLFTTSGRGGLRGVYERLLRKHVLFYDKMARGTKRLAFQQMEAQDIGEIWDKYGAGNAAFVRAVTKGREEKCTAPLLWAGVFFDKERDAAQQALMKMPWASSVMKPAILKKLSWKKQHARANASKASCKGLSVPQIRNCFTQEEMQQETTHYSRYPHDRKPILITDARVANAQDYEGIIYLRSERETGVVEGSKSVRVLKDSCDAQHAALLVQWFPLLFVPKALTPSRLHPRTVELAALYCTWCGEKACAATACMDEEDDRAERRKAMSDVEQYERLAAEFDALRFFTYPDCRAGCN